MGGCGWVHVGGYGTPYHHLVHHQLEHSQLELASRMCMLGISLPPYIVRAIPHV